MAFELGRALLLSDAVTSGALARALYAVATEGIPLPRALVSLGAVDPERLEEELARTDVPLVRHVVPVAELFEALPEGLCSRLLALPIRRDALTGTIDVAVVDPRDPHAAREIAYILKAPVRIVRAPLAALEAALERMVGGPPKARALAPPMWMPSQQATRPTPIWGTPAAQSEERAKQRPNTALTPRRPTDKPPAHPPSDIPIPLVRKSVVEAAPVGETHDDLDVDLLPVNTSPYGFAVLETDTDPDSERPLSLQVPHTVREPYAPHAPSLPFGDPSAILVSIQTSTKRDEILVHLLAGVRMVGRKVALLVVKKNAFVGWACTQEFGDEAQLKAVQIPSSEPSALATVTAGGTYLGPLHRTATHSPLLSVMGATTRDVAISAVRVKGRAAVLIIADELGDTLLATQRIEELARAAGDALARVVLRR